MSLSPRFSQIAGRSRAVPRELVERARDLRRDETDAEKYLWSLVRGKRLLGAKFRRQHLIGPFVADFYCHEARLVVELDGASHRARVEQDEVRDEWLRAHGIRVLRFRNEELFPAAERVLSAIAAALGDRWSQERPPLPPGEGRGEGVGNERLTPKRRPG